MGEEAGGPTRSSQSDSVYMRCKRSKEFLLDDAVADHFRKRFAPIPVTADSNLASAKRAAMLGAPPIDCSNCARSGHHDLVEIWPWDGRWLWCRGLKTGDLPAAMFDHKI